MVLGSKTPGEYVVATFQKSPAPYGVGLFLSLTSMTCAAFRRTGALFLFLLAFPVTSPGTAPLITLPDTSVATDTIAPPQDTLIFYYPSPPVQYQQVDTVAIGQAPHRYLPTVRSKWADLGNIGSDHYSLLPTPAFTIGPRSGLPYDLYQVNALNYTHYDVRYPVTRLRYSLGSAQEQTFGLLHTQNITRRLNFSLDYQKINSKGPYSRQEVDIGDLKLGVGYRTRDHRYAVYAHYERNKTFLMMNGGIVNDSLFTENVADNRDVYPVNLSDAAHDITQDGGAIDQYLRIGGEREQLNDSVGAISDHWELHHSFRGRKTNGAYGGEADTSFYDHILLDSSATKDDIWSLWMRNDLWLRKHFSLDSLSALSISMGYVDIRQQTVWEPPETTDTTFEGGIAEARLDLDLQGFHWELQGEVGVSGRARQEWKGSTGLYWRPGGKTDTIGLNVQAVHQKQAYQAMAYSSNHFYWQQPELPMTTALSGELSYTSQALGLTARASYHQWQNPLFFNEDAIPTVANGTQAVFRGVLEKTFHWRKWYLQNRIVYQKGSGVDAFRFPEFWTRNTLYFQSWMFNKALLGRFGVEFLYYTGFKGYAYMPATRRFHHQEGMETGNYPFFDVFFSGKVRNMVIFAKVEHVNAGLTGYRYLAAPGYPFHDLSIVAGLRWNIFN